MTPWTYPLLAVPVADARDPRCAGFELHLRDDNEHEVRTLQDLYRRLRRRR